MRFAIRNDGSYQVRFTAGTPAVPVTMHLQFQLRDSKGQSHHVTLPPITITPERDRNARDGRGPRTAAQGDIYTVHHEGHLSGFREHLHSPGHPTALGHLEVAHRTGTARFGYGLNVP